MRTSSWVAVVFAASCSPPEEADTVSQVSQEIVGGTSEAQAGSAAVVFLGGCSGVLVNPHTIAAVEHCLPSEPRELQLSRPETEVLLEVRGGARAEACLTPAEGRCGKWNFRVVRSEHSEAVLLQTATALQGVDVRTLPLVASAVPSHSARSHGYGLTTLDQADLENVERRSASMTLTQVDPDHAYGRARDGIRICGGDSGGPLFQEIDSGETPTLIGLLSASEYDPDNLNCTAERGLNRWARLSPPFVASYAGPCIDTPGGIDCRNGGLTRPVPEDRNRRRSFLAQLREEHDLLPIGSRSPAEIEREGLVGLATEEGDFLVRPRATESASRSPASKPTVGGGGMTGIKAPLRPRGIALSGNGDQRNYFFIAEAGNLRPDSSSASSFCGAALIGARIVRTAKHCIESTSRPYYTARYDGGVTTWTFDGGATWVTFNPRQADFHYYGGNYYNFGCDIASGAPMTANCIAQDWALLVMAQDVWDPVNVVPSYSGFTTASVGTGTHVGYPSCGDISNPSVTDCQDFRMFGMDCSIIVNNTSYYYSNCDVSPGDSGGPMFRTISGTRYYVGNHRGGPVNDGCADGTCQTADCGTDSWLYGFQNDLRNTYSAITL